MVNEYSVYFVYFVNEFRSKFKVSRSSIARLKSRCHDCKLFSIVYYLRLLLKSELELIVKYNQIN